MGRIENQEKPVICDAHSGSEVIWECDVCGKQMCEECEVIGFQYKIYCEKCIEQVNLMPKKFAHPVGFWKRLGALLIDGMVLGIMNLFLILIGVFFFTPFLTLTIFCISYLLFVAYFVVFTWKANQTPGKMALEIEIYDKKKTSLSIGQAFLRYGLRFLIGFLYLYGLIAFYDKLQSGMGTEHLGSISDFLKEYHRFGISRGMLFTYYMIGIAMLADGVSVFVSSSKKALHDLLAGTQVILSE